MQINYPYTIDNGMGEKLTFLSLQKDPAGDKLIVENYVTPGKGPLMHTHFLQDECITVVKGRIGYQVLGEEPQYAGVGETVLFKRGVAHKFWNDGEELLHCKGWIQPANTLPFYLGAIFTAQKKSGKDQPELFDSAYLLTRYSSEYDLPELPAFVKKIIMPMVYNLGKLLGKYPHFKNAPEPVKA